MPASRYVQSLAILKATYQKCSNLSQPCFFSPKPSRQKLTTLVKELLRRGKEDGVSCIYLPVIAYCLGLAHSEEDAAAFKSLLNIFDGAGKFPWLAALIHR